MKRKQKDVHAHSPVIEALETRVLMSGDMISGAEGIRHSRGASETSTAIHVALNDRADTDGNAALDLSDPVNSLPFLFVRGTPVVDREIGAPNDRQAVFPDNRDRGNPFPLSPEEDDDSHSDDCNLPTPYDVPSPCDNDPGPPILGVVMDLF